MKANQERHIIMISFSITNNENGTIRKKGVKDAMPLFFRSELFTSYIVTIFNQ